MTDVISKSELPSQRLGQLSDSGLAGLALVAGYYRIAADPMQLSHQLALTGRFAGAEDIVRGANILQLKSRIIRGVTAKRLCCHPLSRDPEIEGRRVRRPWRRFAERARSAWSIRSAVSAREIRNRGGAGAVVRLGRPRHPPARRGGDRSQHLRLPLVLALDPALPPAARPCARRLAVRAALRAGDADLLPARGRQGACPQGHVDAGRARRRHGDARPVRDGPAVPARPTR